jgi:hypothetical protein
MIYIESEWRLETFAVLLVSEHRGCRYARRSLEYFQGTSIEIIRVPGYLQGIES